MRGKPDPEDNRSAAVGTPVPWHVTDVLPLPNQGLRVRFADGTAGEVEMRRLIWGPRAGVFERLRDPGVFDSVYIEHGAVTWPGGLDLAPDAMYDAIRATGHWIPGTGKSDEV